VGWEYVVVEWECVCVWWRLLAGKKFNKDTKEKERPQHRITALFFYVYVVQKRECDKYRPICINTCEPVTYEHVCLLIYFAHDIVKIQTPFTYNIIRGVQISSIWCRTLARFWREYFDHLL
jgi:hypothetical protein